MLRNIQKIFFHFEIIAFELIALNTRLYWERIVVIGVNMLTNSVKISHTTKTEFLEVISFQSDQKIRQKYCRADLSSFSDTLTCWLSTSVLTQRFLAI